MKMRRTSFFFDLATPRRIYDIFGAPNLEIIK